MTEGFLKEERIAVLAAWKIPGEAEQAFIHDTVTGSFGNVTWRLPSRITSVGKTTLGLLRSHGWSGPTRTV